MIFLVEGLRAPLLHHVVNPSRACAHLSTPCSKAINEWRKPIFETLPIVSKNIAHHFGKHCPSFQKTLPVIFPAVAHRFEKTWATKMQKKGRHRKNGSAPPYVFLRKCEPVALLFISNHGSSTTDLYPALCHGSSYTSPSHRRYHPVSRHTDGTSALPPG